VGQLVAADRDQVRVAEEDVGRLVHGVGEHQGRCRAAADGDLVLHRRVPAQLRDADEAEEREHELVQLGDLAVGEDDGAVGIDSRRQVIGDQPLDVTGEVIRRVAVGDRLVVGDEHEQLDPEPLETDPVFERAEVMADVQRAGRTVAGQDPERRRVGQDRPLELGAAALGGGECG
jgi:hypothetical protein